MMNHAPTQNNIFLLDIMILIWYHYIEGKVKADVKEGGVMKIRKSRKCKFCEGWSF